MELGGKKNHIKREAERERRLVYESVITLQDDFREQEQVWEQEMGAWVTFMRYLSCQKAKPECNAVLWQ